MAQLSHINIPRWKAHMRRLGFTEQGAQDFADALDREIADRATKLDLEELELRIIRWNLLATRPRRRRDHRRDRRDDPLPLLNSEGHIMAAHAPRINLRLWINMLRRAGWSARSAEEVAEQLDAELHHSASGEAFKDLELRLIRHIDARAMLIIAAIGLMIAVAGLLFALLS